jgi:anti-sigma factor RsiW
MTCRERQAKFVEWILEELPAAEVQELESHVEQCQECAHALAGVRGVEQTLKQHLSDREMPARLVFLAEKPQGFAAGLWTSLARTAALAATAAVVFVAVLLGAYSTWGGQLPGAAPAAVKAGLARAEVNALIASAIERAQDRQQKELVAAHEELATNLRQEQAQTLRAVLQQLDYLEAAQKAVWRENQEQNAVMQYMAQTTLQADPAQP